MRYLKLLIIALMLLLTSLSAVDAVWLSDDKNPDVMVYSVKNSQNYKQLTFKASAIDVSVAGDGRKKIEIVLYARERKQNSDKAEAYFNAYKKNQAVLKESEPSKIYRLESSETAQELILDYKSIDRNSKYDIQALIILPANCATQLDIEAGNISIDAMESELLINNTAGNVTINNSRGVANLITKAGNLEIKGFQGVINSNLISGNLEIDKTDGDLTVKMLSGNCEISNFTGKIKINNKVGNLEMKNIRKSDIQVKNISGDIELKNLLDCGNVKLSNESGEIAVSDSKMRKLSIQGNGGDIDLSNVDAIFRISSRAGDVTLSTNSLQLSEDNLIELDFGDIELNIKDKQSYQYFKNQSGERQYDADKTIEAESYLRISKKGGVGKLFLINVDTGSITVK